MDNLEIRRSKHNKRNVESLIDESAIDHEFNYEAIELRKAFNETIKDLTNENNRLIIQNQKYKNLLRQYQAQKNARQNNLKLIQSQVIVLRDQIKKFKSKNDVLKKKNDSCKFKLQQIEINRQAVENDDGRDHNAINNRDPYKQIRLYLTHRVKGFLSEIKIHPMSEELQYKIQSFLQELVYINPNTINSSQHKKHRNLVGQITTRPNLIQKSSRRQPLPEHLLSQNTEMQSNDENSWRRLQISLEKLKNIEKSVSPFKKIERTQYSSPYSKYDGLSPSQNINKSKRKIFAQGR